DVVADPSASARSSWLARVATVTVPLGALIVPVTVARTSALAALKLIAAASATGPSAVFAFGAPPAAAGEPWLCASDCCAPACWLTSWPLGLAPPALALLLVFDFDRFCDRSPTLPPVLFSAPSDTTTA